MLEKKWFVCLFFTLSLFISGCSTPSHELYKGDSLRIPRSDTGRRQPAGADRQSGCRPIGAPDARTASASPGTAAVEHTSSLAVTPPATER